MFLLNYSDRKYLRQKSQSNSLVLELIKRDYRNTTQENRRLGHSSVVVNWAYTGQGGQMNKLKKLIH